jgi:hypothetical protein
VDLLHKTFPLFFVSVFALFGLLGTWWLLLQWSVMCIKLNISLFHRTNVHHDQIANGGLRGHIIQHFDIHCKLVLVLNIAEMLFPWILIENKISHPQNILLTYQIPSGLHFVLLMAKCTNCICRGLYCVNWFEEIGDWSVCLFWWKKSLKIPKGGNQKP